MADSIDQKADVIAAPPDTLPADNANGSNPDPVAQPDEDILSRRVTLADICAKGTALYAHKSYDEAAECFATAAELQADMNGEMNPENSEILFLYGRSLFKVGQSKSDVLGGKAAGDKKKPTNAAKQGGASKAEASAAPAETEAERITEEGVAIVAADKEGEKKAEEVLEAKKPLFQFTGDENFDDSDEEGGAEAEGEPDEEEEEDDLAVAFEVLDLSRVLFNKRLEHLTQTEADEAGKGKAAYNGDSPMLKHVKERLADTHDLLAEISLENERYPNAIVDSRESLKFKEQLYPEESEIIAEAHFKLSLALEFASITSTGEDGHDGEEKRIDQGLRDEAAQELEAAISSTRMKLRNKEVELATMASPEDNDLTRAQIAEVKEIIADMEQRLADLRDPPIDIDKALGHDNVMGGILGAALGESAAQTEARLEEAKKNAKDLSGLVRKKHKDEPAAAAQANGDGNGKRKAEGDPMDEDQSKKARVEDAMEA